MMEDNLDNKSDCAGDDEELKETTDGKELDTKPDAMPEILTKEKIEEEKRNYLESDEYAQYSNCIIIKGAKDLNNFILNSGQINGAISQELNTSENEQTDTDNIVKFRELDNLEKFIEYHANSIYAPAFIALVVLKMVPQAYIIEIAEHLQEQMDVEVDNQSYRSIGQIKDIVGAEEGIFEVNTELGIVESEFLVLRNPEWIPEVLKGIWNNYPALRSKIMNWLLEIRKNKRYRRFILLQTRDAFADFAALDFSYIKTDIIPYFQTKGYDHLFYLTGILERALQMESIQENADKLLCQWCSLDNNYLTQVVLCLYDHSAHYDFHKALKLRLQAIAEDEFNSAVEYSPEQSYTNDFAYYYKKYSTIPFRVMQRNMDAAELYVEALCRLFQQCNSRIEKVKFGYYFSHLFYQDYFAEDNKHFFAIFINCAGKKEIRVKMRPILHYLVSKRVFWQRMRSVLVNGYIKELSHHQSSWDYMKPFFRELAFTGDKEHYYQMIDMLERVRGNDPGAVLAGQIKAYLQSLLEVQKQKRRV